MESARLPRPVDLPSGVQLGLIGLLIVGAAIGWTVTDDRMAGMDTGPGTDLGSLGFYVTAWVVMMAAMMFPSIAPMVVMHARIQAGKRERGDAVPIGVTPVFVAGYLLTWTLAGLGFYSVFALGDSLDLGFLSWDQAGPYVAGGVIAAAALYQLTPLKDVCLRKCRNPLMFLLTAWRPGRIGALRMGVEHGGWCVGCCWMLMAALFAVGVMSVGWMVFIAALIAIEKLLPWKAAANRGIAILLLTLGLGVAFVPERVPGLTLPDSPEAAQAMEAMGMDDDGGSGNAMDENMGGKEMNNANVGGGKRTDESIPGKSMDSGGTKAKGP
jgi:predicted metal-binding membrane protein